MGRPKRISGNRSRLCTTIRWALYIELPLDTTQDGNDMHKSPLLRRIHPFGFLLIALFVLSCQSVHQPDPQTTTTPPPVTTPSDPNLNLTGVLMWKGDPSESGLYATETTLTQASVNVNQFGRIGSFQADGIVMAQPLFVSALDMGDGSTRDVVIIATE